MKHTDLLSLTSPLGPLQWPFIKMHGLENYFVILDRRDGNKPLSVDDIVRICSTNIGVGGEQLLTIEQPSHEGSRAGAYAAIRIFNIDGKEVGACGNATRCMAHLLLEETGKDELAMELAGGIVHCRRAGPMEVSVTLGPISMDWRKIPLSREVDTAHLPIASGPLSDGVGLYIGNPHAVFFVDQVDCIDMAHFAPAVHNDSLFSEGANVGVAEIVDHATLRLKVWERPGVLTRACGTGACVAAYAALKRGLVTSKKVAVHLPAGKLDIELLDDDKVRMAGPVAFCCYGFLEAGR
ncbi:diaminopimelate epimerase [Mesorhizobium sp. VK9D]|uniref:diaminopimelate epimerase n=1 Tax=Mesorhizobium australafricanum TaxID=3072311 RepID=UPI002A24E28F|nr:diaminopimelate epimerase [Mesorhizobium sp. VK9D]MDX8455291.1 diaminopimelate epimerase [Mesorhizobium sp. VK9D]